MSLEKRFITSDQSEIRAYSEEDRMIIEGYASKYNVESEYLTGNAK